MYQQLSEKFCWMCQTLKKKCQKTQATKLSSMPHRKNKRLRQIQNEMLRTQMIQKEVLGSFPDDSKGSAKEFPRKLIVSVFQVALSWGSFSS